MTDTARTYDKANSILQLYGDDVDPERTRARLKAWDAVRTPLADADGEGIVRTALDDLLDRAPEPRFRLRPHIAAEMARLDETDFARYLRYRYRYEIHPAAGILDDHPPCVQIEPTSVCNYRCVFCYQVDPVFSKRDGGVLGAMTLERFRRVIDQLDGAVEAVTLASRGEPSLCRDLPGMLAYMAGRFLAAKLNTNASRLDEPLCHALLSAGLQTLVISADAAEPDHYARLRVNGSLDRVLANVERLRDIQTRHYPDSRTILRVSGVKVDGEQSLEAMRTLWRGLVDQVVFVDFNPWVDGYHAEPNGQERPCSDLWRRMFVWWDGTVNPCDVDFRSTLAVGHVDRDGVSAIWRGAGYEALRRRHLGGERQRLTPCAGCAVV